MTVPKVPHGYVSVCAQYTIRLAPGHRDAFAAALKAEGIPTPIYYLIPLHRQQAYGKIRWARAAYPSANAWRTRSSACRCKSISFRRRSTASSKLCAVFWSGSRTEAECPADRAN